MASMQNELVPGSVAMAETRKTARETLADHADKMERNAKEMTDHVVRIREFLAMLDSVPGLGEAVDTALS